VSLPAEETEPALAMPLAPHEEQDSVPVAVGDAPQVREVEAAVVPKLPARRHGVGKADRALAVVARMLHEVEFADPGTGNRERAALLREEFGHLFFGPVAVHPADCGSYRTEFRLRRRARVLPILLHVEVHPTTDLVGRESVVHDELFDRVYRELEAVSEVEDGAGKNSALFGDEEIAAHGLQLRELFRSEKPELPLREREREVAAEFTGPIHEVLRERCGHHLGIGKVIEDECCEFPPLPRGRRVLRIHVHLFPIAYRASSSEAERTIVIGLASGLPEDRGLP
jgi:hypothetical protein